MGRDRTECVPESSVEGTTSPQIIWILREEAVNLAILCTGRQIRLHPVLQFFGGAVREMKQSLDQSLLFTHEMFSWGMVNKVASSSQSPGAQMNTV
jgi:hypothetical protein